MREMIVQAGQTFIVVFIILGVIVGAVMQIIISWGAL